jgi:hypothetical protein
MKKLTHLFVCFTLLFISSLAWGMDDRFDYEPGYEVARFEEDKKDRDYTRYKGHLITANPLTGEDYKSEFHYYETTEEGEHPLVLVLPPIGGVNMVDKSVASYLANRGINVLIALTPENIADLNRPLDDIDGFFIRTTVSVRHLIDFATDREKVDPSRIGGFGASLGGIRLLTLIGVDDRVTSSIMYVAAGNIPEVLANSEQDIIKDYREAKMKELGLESREEYFDLLTQYSTVEPLHNVHNFEADNVFMKISNKDKSVPTKNQWETQEAIGIQNIKETDSSHVGAVIGALFERKKIYKFLKSKW